MKSIQMSTAQPSAWQRAVVIGLGVTGFSAARYLHGRGLEVSVVDSHASPPFAMYLAEVLPGIGIQTGGFDYADIKHVDVIVLSPGVPLTHPAVQAARDAGIEVVGDIELFARVANAPVIGITGSNGKSTVSRWLGELLEIAGQTVRVGGNIGQPVLDLLGEEPPDCYVLELSSFQLESTHSLVLRAAAILNLTPDHLDRYASFEEYQDAKWRITRDSQTLVFNRDDPALQRRVCAYAGRAVSFGNNPPTRPIDFGIVTGEDGSWLVRGEEHLVRVETVRLVGHHNVANALAATALAFDSIEISSHILSRGLSEFSGLPHRCELVGTWGGVRWINDSKGTNVGATVAALEGLDEPVILIAGGQAKSADFSTLFAALSLCARCLVVYGQDRERIARSAPTDINVIRVDHLAAAVDNAAELACEGDVVLFSPACASHDQFNNFEHRGDTFRRLVKDRNS